MDDAGKLLVAQAELTKAGDNLALAAARVCTEYDGVHRLRAALSKWYELRADRQHGADDSREKDEIPA